MHLTTVGFVLLFHMHNHMLHCCKSLYTGLFSFGHIYFQAVRSTHSLEAPLSHNGTILVSEQVS